MSYKKRFVRAVTYPLHERLKGQGTVEAYRAMHARDRWPADRLADYQAAQLRKLIAVAYDRSPFYRKRFDGTGVLPGDIRTAADLNLLPFLTKDDIRENKYKMLTVPAEQVAQLVPFATGGSTGEPMTFLVDRGYTANGWAACWRARSWWGLDWGDPWFWLWGSPIELSTGDRLRSTVKTVRDWVINRSLLSAFKMTPGMMASYIDRIIREKPSYIYAYSSAAFFLAEYILARGIDLSTAAPRVIFTTSDMLYPAMREAVERAFHCPVSVEYGSREGSFIAQDCPESGLHIHSDRVYVEVINGSRRAAPGELGELAITVLDGFATPFIRYRTGDFGILSDAKCPCGRAFPLLKSIEGRSEDFLVSREGRLIHGQAIAHVLKEIDGISRYRVIQEDTESLTIDVVPTNRHLQMPMERLNRGVQHLFGYAVRIDVHVVDQIPVPASGKYRPVTSKVQYSSPRVLQ